MDPELISYRNFDFKNRVLDTKLRITLQGETVVCDDLSGGRENFCIPVVCQTQNKCRPPKIIYPKFSIRSLWFRGSRNNRRQTVANSEKQTNSLPVPKYVAEKEYGKFRVCCDCKDGCKPDTCACMKLTYEGYANTEQFGKFRRLLKKQYEQKEITHEQYKGIPLLL